MGGTQFKEFFEVYTLHCNQIIELKSCVFTQVLDCLEVDSGEGVKFSSETLFVPDKYDIV